MRRLIFIFSMLLIVCAGQAKTVSHSQDSVYHGERLYVNGLRIYSDSAIYQGINLKLDMFNSILEAARSKGQLQTYEIALNARLKQRFFPTLELGYAFGQTGNGTTSYDGQGGFCRVGVDINGLKRNAKSLNGLLVGIRVGTAYQDYSLTGVPMNDHYWQKYETADYLHQRQCDAWGEIVGGCQVHIVSGLMMGWYLRYKLLFTRKASGEHVLPYYIPGYGYRDDSQWGINYYIGWKF